MPRFVRLSVYRVSCSSSLSPGSRQPPIPVPIPIGKETGRPRELRKDRTEKIKGGRGEEAPATFTRCNRGKRMRRTLPATWLYIIIGILITNHFPRLLLPLFTPQFWGERSSFRPTNSATVSPPLLLLFFPPSSLYTHRNHAGLFARRKP